MSATISRLHRLAADAPAADGALLEAFLAGDHAAFALLVRRHGGLVFATCRRVLRHQQDTEDAFQAVFLVLARRAGDVWPRDAVGSWLFGVAHRVALKARTTRARRTGRESPLEDTAAAEPAAGDFDTAEAVHRAVSKLPEVYRAAVVACDLQGLSRKEAAERLGWTEGTLSGRLARARALLATRLRRLGLSVPAAGAALAAPAAVSAALVRSACDLVTGGTVPAPVLALTEGAVRSMAVFKLKAMAAVVLAACALGYGALAAPGDGPGTTDTPNQKQQPQPQRGGVAGGMAPPVAPPSPPKPASDLDPLQGEWVAVSISEGDKRQVRSDFNDWVLTISGGTLKMPYHEAGGLKQQREYKIAVDGTKTPKTIDMIDGNNPVARGLYEFVATGACAKCHAGLGAPPKEPPPGLADVCDLDSRAAALNLRLALSIDGKRPTKFGGEGVIVFELVRATQKSDLAPAARDVVQARLTQDALRASRELEDADRVLAKARNQAFDKLWDDPAIIQALERRIKAKADYERVLAELKALKAEAKKPPTPAPGKDEPAFTVHVRPLTAAEKVIRVKATGSDCVLDALVHVTDVPIRAGAVTAWVVRGDEILPVDLVAITKNGETKTNHALRAGDKLFVQSKPAK